MNDRGEILMQLELQYAARLVKLGTPIDRAAVLCGVSVAAIERYLRTSSDDATRDARKSRGADETATLDLSTRLQL